MSSEQPRRAGGSGGSPIGSTAAIIIAVVAVVGGFFILKQINDDDGGSSNTTIETGSTGTTVTTLPTGETLPGATVPGVTTGVTTPVESTLPATTPAVEATTGATVVVANASTVDGAAGRFTTALEGKKFTMGKAVTANIKLPVSVVYYVATDTAAQAVATYLASLLGGVSVEPMPSPAPVDGGTLADGVTVVLMLGSDKADKTLAEAGAPSTTIPGTGVPTTLAPTATT